MLFIDSSLIKESLNALQTRIYRFNVLFQLNSQVIVSVLKLNNIN